MNALLLGACQRSGTKLPERPPGTTRQVKDLERPSKEKSSSSKLTPKAKKPEEYEEESLESQFQQKITEEPYKQIDSDKFDQPHK